MNENGASVSFMAVGRTGARVLVRTVGVIAGELVVSAIGDADRGSVVTTNGADDCGSTVGIGTGGDASTGALVGTTVAAMERGARLGSDGRGRAGAIVVCCAGVAVGSTVAAFVVGTVVGASVLSKHSGGGSSLKSQIPFANAQLFSNRVGHRGVQSISLLRTLSDPILKAAHPHIHCWNSWSGGRTINE